MSLKTCKLVSWCFEPSQPHGVISGLRALQRYFCLFFSYTTHKETSSRNSRKGLEVHIHMLTFKGQTDWRSPLAETLRAKRPSVNEPAVSAKTTVINPAAPTVVSFDDRVGTICSGDERCRPWIGFQSAVSKISALGVAVDVVSSDSDLFAFCCSLAACLVGWLAGCLSVCVLHPVS